MILPMLLSAALALPARAVISHGEAPEAAPETPIWQEFPTASVTVAPEAAAAAVPQLPAALPAAAAAAAASPAAEPAASGQAAVGQRLGAVSQSIAPDIQATRKGGDADAASAGESIQDALDGDAPAPASQPSVLLKIYSDEPVKTGPTMIAAIEGDKVVTRPLLDAALDTGSAQAASYRYAYASAAEAAKQAKLGKPRFVEAWREKGGWTFHFAAGGRYLRVYARDGHQPAERAWVGSEFSPESSLALSPMQFGQKIGPEPRWALIEAARRFGVAQDSLGLSLVTLPKSNSLWYLIDAEDGRRVAYNMKSGNVRKLENGPLGRDKIEAAARALAGHKGYPFSQTEYRAAYAGYADSLRQDGATRAQLALFERLMDQTPVRGGRFNPWSGD